MTKRVVSVEAADKPFAAVLKMINMDIGSVVVRRGNVVAGIMTKGDILRNIVKAGLDPRKASAADLMSKHIITVPSSSSVEFASRLMTKHTMSKLPVIGRRARRNNRFI